MEAHMTTTAKPPQAVLGEMINGYWKTFSICIAAKLGVADRLANGPVAIDEIARSVEANSDALYRVLRALSALGIFHEGDDKTFSNTALSEPLRSDVPGSVRGLGTMTLMLHARAWPEIEQAVRTGKTAFGQAFGAEIFDWLGAHADAARVFDSAFGGYTAMVSKAVASAQDFSRFERIVDVGGGNGSLVSAILASVPKARGVNYDLPSVAARARETLAKAGLADRCETVGGDFFDAVPEGGDAYLLKMILHDWDDARAVAILKNVRRAIRPAGALFVVEAVVGEANAGPDAKLLDVNMLVMTGGRERTKAEYAALCAAAGFALERIAQAGPTNVIEARPIG
jgi:predicted O-methyltransferase YrrM